MEIWANIRTCGAYCVYLFTLFWMLTKEFLGYTVDWSKCPPATPGTLGRRADKDVAEPQDCSKPKPTITIQHSTLEKSKDLEANLDELKKNPSSVSVSEKTAEACREVLIIYETPTLKIVEPPASVDNRISTLPATQPTAKHEADPSTHELSHATQHSPVLKPLLEPGLEANFNSRVSRPQPPKLDSTKPEAAETDLASTIKAIATALQDHHEVHENTISRLKFVKGLKYIENSNFRFPSLISSLRSRSRSLPRTRSLKSARALALVSTLDLNRSPSTLSSKSSHSSIYTTPSAPSTSSLRKANINSKFPPQPQPSSSRSFATPPDEDIPINFITHMTTLPSWRRDPERAMNLFGILTRSVIPSVTTVNEVDEREKGEEVGIVNVMGFESMIISMGLVTPPIFGDPSPSTVASSSPSSPSSPTTTSASSSSASPSASTLSSSSSSSSSTSGSSGSDMDLTSFAHHPEEDIQEVREKEKEGEEADAVVLESAKSRESVMSDVLSWVESGNSDSNRV